METLQFITVATFTILAWTAVWIHIKTQEETKTLNK